MPGLPANSGLSDWSCYAARRFYFATWRLHEFTGSRIGTRSAGRYRVQSVGSHLRYARGPTTKHVKADHLPNSKKPNSISDSKNPNWISYSPNRKHNPRFQKSELKSISEGCEFDTCSGDYQSLPKHTFCVYLCVFVCICVCLCRFVCICVHFACICAYLCVFVCICV